LQLQKARMTQLNESWGFQCDCGLCSADTSIIRKSDARINQILELRSNLRNYRPGAQAGPEMAETLVALYNEEKIWGPVNEAYMLAAIEWNAVGDLEMMKKYALLAIDSGKVYRGEAHREVEDMKALLNNAENHWSWRLRVGKD
jgi:hypothetical protein